MESPFQGPSGVQPNLSLQNPYPGQNPAMIPSGVQEGETGMDSTAGMTQAEMEEQKRNNLNVALLCQMGQETVQEIVTKTAELFSLLKSLQLPIDTAQSLSTQEEKKMKIQEYIKTVTMNFKKLRRICEMCNYDAATMGYTHIEVDSLIPLKEEIHSRQEDKNPTDLVKASSAEYRELVEQVMMKNRQLKEIIDSLRSFCWDINAMLCTR